jgi:hypothetical protein
LGLDAAELLPVTPKTTAVVADAIATAVAIALLTRVPIDLPLYALPVGTAKAMWTDWMGTGRRLEMTGVIGARG